MAHPKSLSTHRARDPGVRLPDLGQVTWVHCPHCNGAAKYDRRGVSCPQCGHMTIPRPAEESPWATIDLTDPRCTFCRLPLDNPPRPTAFMVEGKKRVRVRCDACSKTVDYPARLAFSPQHKWHGGTLALYLTAQVAGHELWVDNLAHLGALESYLGALVRERGAVGGMTMMARLPAWMKSSANRDKVVRGLHHLRAKAAAAGIDE